jgi:hypothetical protein
MIRFPAWIRVLSAFAALLVAGEHGLASLHQALTPHEVCAEHGELIHADHQPAAAVAQGTAPAVEEGPRAEAEHHHCGVIPASPARAPVATRASDCVAGAAALAQASEPFERHVVSADVLAFAPKQSPPA